MKSPVAKHLNTFNKPSIIAHKRRSKQMDTEMLEAKEDAAEAFLGRHRQLADAQFICVGFTREEFDTDEDKCLNGVGRSNLTVEE